VDGGSIGGLLSNFICIALPTGSSDVARRINRGDSSGSDERDELDTGKILGVCPLDGMEWYIGITENFYREDRAASSPWPSLGFFYP
jgi:hypothetical protein